MASIDIEQIDEQFVFTPKLKKGIFTIFGIGTVLMIIGIVLLVASGDGHDHAAIGANADVVAQTSENAVQAEGGEHHAISWTTRIWTNLWINNVFFTGLALIGIFWVAIQYVANAGWSVVVNRIPLQFAKFLPISFGLMLVVFIIANHDIFHWTHTYLYDANGAEFDEIIDGKKGFFFNPFIGDNEIPSSIPIFYYLRMVFFFVGWILISNFIRKESLAEDINGGLRHYRRVVRLSGAFIVFFAVSSSISAWDWVMSIDTHWFSTMFGWYTFASWFAAGLAAITLMVVFLKESGYLKVVNENHLHDLGKFVFAFSIFWTYIWFSQFLLIYYANIPEETVYFLERLQSPFYGKFIIINLIFNFFFPFLALMTRDSKRKMAILKIVCVVVLLGHWLDFYLMITPAVLRDSGSLGFLEIGLVMMYLAAFLFVVFNNLSKVKLIAPNHPMLQESLHHNT